MSGGTGTGGNLGRKREATFTLPGSKDTLPLTKTAELLEGYCIPIRRVSGKNIMDYIGTFLDKGGAIVQYKYHSQHPFQNYTLTAQFFENHSNARNSLVELAENIGASISFKE